MPPADCHKNCDTQSACSIAGAFAIKRHKIKRLKGLPHKFPRAKYNIVLRFLPCRNLIFGMKKFSISAIFTICLWLCAAVSFAAPQKSGNWTIEGKVVTAPDGAIILSKGASATLSPKLNGGDFKDFELSFKARTINGATGFLAFHTDPDFSKGYKVAIDNSKTSKVWWRKTGSLIGVRNIVKRISEDGQWAQIDVKVSGNLVEIDINSHRLVEYAEPENPYRLPQNANMRLGKGGVALKCVSGDGIEIKDFKIKRLAATGKKVEAEPESADGVIALHQSDFPVLDYHVHLKGDLDSQKAKKQSLKYGINYAIAVNCGKDFPVNKDSLALEFLEKNKEEPYILAMQAEGREWMKLISKPVRDKFAYSFTDGMTFEDYDGNRVHLWKPNEVKIKDKEAYMDMIVEKICGVLGEPADIYANATYLPDALAPEYKKLWTKQRRQKVLDALARGGMALEISAKYNIPDAEFIKAAKARGVKFTFGSNNGDSNFGKLEYCIKIMRECGLTPEDMFNPNRGNR